MFRGFISFENGGSVVFDEDNVVRIDVDRDVDMI